MTKVTPRWIARNFVRRVPVANARLPLDVWSGLWGGADGPGIDAVSIIGRIADQAGRPLTVVQVGANDGSMGDPLHDTIVKHRWRALLVEPLPHLFAALKKNYAGVPNLSFEQAAIGLVDGTMTMYSVTPRPGDPVWAIGLSSFRRDVIMESQDEIPDIADRITEVEVPVMRLDTLLRKHGIDRVDVLQTDTEGYDFEILRQIDYSRWAAPRHLIYEACHLDGTTLDKTHEMLTAAGYTIVPAGYDEYAYRT
ncbi:FkbM family methyltransferase [Pseudofrankia asymbiotica]|uniref:FkbM family methyltransferase n=1 Tax=Pseudofrankia asymbiotica TaxID=1834516 RepID=A0A1V2IN60_9ACTN|nr:FkbM family methyltransferase [Pseudofrankia asymbiotica]ONH33926.1 FkbM family methyltransferase [Pseudofrankia asymbiotica]